MDFGRWVHDTRKRKHITQAELGKMTGMTQTAIGQIERGERTPYRRNQKKITVALNAARDRTAVPDYAIPARGGKRAGLAGPMSNGDAIRRMVDEELVFYIPCPIRECKVPYNDRDCYQCKLGWLRAKPKKTEAEGGDV